MVDALDATASEFWSFSLAFYEQPGVAPACLELQDRYGRDVILALYCCWVGTSGRGRLGPAELAAAEAAARPWRKSVVEVLRGARKALKGIAGAQPLYARMKSIELAAEREAHRRLAALAPAADPRAAAQSRRADAAANLALYAGGDAAAAAAPLGDALPAMIER